jgi:hypothetical protein
VFHVGTISGERQSFLSPSVRKMGPAVRNALQGGASKGTPGSVRTFKVGYIGHSERRFANVI